MGIKNTTVIKMDPRDPDAVKIQDVLRACREGKIVAFPTETVYGIGGPMDVPGLAEAIAVIKSRDPSKPLSYHISNFSMVDSLDVPWTPALKFMARRYWPGPLTLLVLNRQGEKVGIRYPRNHITLLLIQGAGVPFLASSANKSGMISPKNAQEVVTQLSGEIDFVIDGGPTDMNQDSTIVDLTTDPPAVVRPGADLAHIEQGLDAVRLGRFPHKKILFVCTGNSCRSPMAAGWLINELKKNRLDEKIEVASCGTGARIGAAPTTEASLVMRNREIDITKHRSHGCTGEDFLSADLIFAMSEEHVGFIAGLTPQVRDRIRVLGIPDPIGMGMMIYEQVLAGIERKLKACWKEIIS